MALDEARWDTLALASAGAQTVVLVPRAAAASSSSSSGRPGLQWGLARPAAAAGDGDATAGQAEEDQAAAELAQQRAVLSVKRRMMAAMLHDSRRNAAYARALERAVAAAGDRPAVLDIGAGTGLLSLLAARAGAARVVGCEMNEPLAAVARQVVTANKADETVAILDQRSSELLSPPSEEDKVDVIVTETLDSNLLTEGIVGSIADAARRLAKENAWVIPGAARVFAQVATCGDEDLHGLSVGDFMLDATCGQLRGHERSSDVVLAVDEEELTNFHAGRLRGLQRLSEPAVVLEVDFSRPDDLAETQFIDLECDAIGAADARAQFVLCWWELDVSPRRLQPSKAAPASSETREPSAKRAKTAEGGGASSARDAQDSSTLSTDPSIDEASEAWQDHWFPLVVPLRHVLPPAQRFKLSFAANAGRVALQEVAALARDGSAIAGDARRALPAPAAGSLLRSTNLHYKRERVAQLACQERSDLLRDALHAAVQCARSLGAAAVRVLDVSDGSLCAALASCAPCAAESRSLERSASSQAFWSRLLSAGATLRLEPNEDADDSAAATTGDPDIDWLVDGLAERDAVVLASELYFEAAEQHPVLSAFMYLEQVRWLRQSGKLPAQVFAVPGRCQVFGALASLPRLSQVLAWPQTILGLDHGVPAGLAGGGEDELAPVALWSYEHALVSDAAPLVTLDAAGGTAEGLAGQFALPEPRPPGLALVVWVETDVHVGRPSRWWFERHLVRPIDAHADACEAVALNVLRVALDLREPGTVRFRAEVAA